MRKTNTNTATSPAAMGKALVILATSCAALSGQNAIPTAARRASHQRQQRCMANGGRVHHQTSSSGAKHQSMIALRYRDGDDDQPPDMQAANRGAVASEMDPSTLAPVATPSSRVSTQFFMAPIVRLMPARSMPTVTPTASVSSPSSAASKEEDERQLVMDEYLESLERRYNRMHPKHSPQNGKKHSAGMRPKVVLDFHFPGKIFLSTLSLHRSPPSTLADQPVAAVPSSEPQTSAASRTVAGYAAAAARQAMEDEAEEDPLNALGLKNLASARLQQRLHVPRDLRDEHMLLTSGTTSAVNFFHHCMQLNDHTYRAASSVSRALTIPNEGGRTSSYTSLSFTAQFKLLFATLQRITLAFVYTVRIMAAFSSRMFSEIVEKGGFRHSVRMMSAASVAILLMFRPLFRGALKQG